MGSYIQSKVKKAATPGFTDAHGRPINQEDWNGGGLVQSQEDYNRDYAVTETKRKSQNGVGRGSHAPSVTPLMPSRKRSSFNF